jgi:serine/threonine protein kinase
LEIGKPISVQHVFKMQFDPQTGKMMGGDNVPEEFRKLFADILDDGSSSSGIAGNDPQSKQGMGALDAEDQE